MRVGTIVRPFSAVLPIRRSISRRCSSSLRGRSGSWFSRARLVRRDVHVAQPDLAVAHLGVGVLELHRAVAQRLDLRALQHDPGLELARAGCSGSSPGGWWRRRPAAALRLRFLAIGLRVCTRRATRSTRPRARLDPVDRHLDRVARAAAGGPSPRPPAPCRARSASTSRAAGGWAAGPRSPPRRSARTRPSRSGRPPRPRSGGVPGSAPTRRARAGTRGRRRRRRARSSSPRARSPRHARPPRRARAPGAAAWSMPSPCSSARWATTSG